ncbi:hypothetical protein [Enterococcus sp. AZ103]|uniref:hypothetical protein n=1 Tax=Enterococcus sp. AZ103 TaxID=2774628 RepID=UPI003F1FA7BB
MLNNDSSKIKIIQNFTLTSTQTVFSNLFYLIGLFFWYYWLGERNQVSFSLWQVVLNWGLFFMFLASIPVIGMVYRNLSRYAYLNRRKILYWYLQIAILSGVLLAAALWLLAPVLVHISGGLANTISVLRVMAFSVLIYPSLQVLRSYFQTKEPAFYFSFTTQAVITTIYLLISGFTIKLIWQENNHAALVQAAFAQFAGLLAACFIFIFLLLRERHQVEILEPKVHLEKKEVLSFDFKKVIPYAVTLVALLSYRLVDQVTFMNQMRSFTNYSQEQLLHLQGLFTSQPLHLLNFLPALAQLIVVANLSLLTNWRPRGEAISVNFQLGFYFLLLPSLLALLLGGPLYQLFYQKETLASQVFILAVIVQLVFSFFVLVSGALQATGGEVQVIVFWLIGLIVKLILQLPAINLLEVFGPLSASLVGCLVSVLLMSAYLIQSNPANYKMLGRRILLILVLTLFSFGLATGCAHFLLKRLNFNEPWQAVINIVVVIAVAAFSYFFISLKIRLLDQLFGPEVRQWRKKFHIK